jgi:O-succinylbenzoic acid--CoA ligase
MSRRGDDVITLHAVGWLGAVAVPMAVDQPDSSAWCEALGVDHLLEQVADGVLEHAPRPRPWPLDEVRFLLATSGTTGSAKTVALTTGQVLFSAFGSAMRLGHLPSDRWLNPLPLHHVGGLSVLMRCLLGGSTVDLHERFDAEAVAASLRGGEVTQVSCVPMMLDAVLNALDGQPVAPQLRTILVGGAKASASLLQRCAAMHLPVAMSWGMTETASQAATLPVGALSGPAPALPCLEVVAEADRLLVRGPAAGGVCVTGDRGVLDGLGRVTVSGRVDATIISGGENIDPAEVEAVLNAHPDVARAYVVAVPDATYGERPAAALVPAGDARPTMEALRAWCAPQLERFKIPDRMLWLSEVPQSTLGKVQRFELSKWLSRVAPTDEGGDRR